MNRETILREITNLLADSESVTPDDLPIEGITWVNRVVFLLLRIARYVGTSEEFQDILDDLDNMRENLD